uniref:Glycosyltransferase family 1 protein n=1 Tax=candidate division CPR3 bacterium TaxID=2268181 RepID=A0A7C5YQX8_UNCC3
MKILLITPGRLPIPANLGGAIEDYILSLGRELVSLGVDITILDISRSFSDRSPKIEVLQGIKIVRIPKYAVIPVNLKSNNVLMRSKRLLDEFIWGISVKRFIEARLRTGRLPWDIVHFNSPIPLIVNSKLLTKNGIKVVYTEHTYFASKRAGTFFFRKILEPKIMKSVLSSSSAIIALSSKTASALATFGISNDKIHVIALGIDKQYLCTLDTEMSKSFELPSGSNATSFIITFLGRIHPQKGIETLLEAAKMLKEHGVTDFVILIGGPLSGDFSVNKDIPSLYALKLMKYIKKERLKHHVVFLGHLTQEQKMALLNTSSVFVLPSYYETFGLVALEAMASGVPVIGSKVGALCDIIRNGYNGYLFKPGSSEELFSILLSLYRNKGHLKELGKNARETARKYLWSNIAKRTYELYKKLS